MIPFRALPAILLACASLACSAEVDLEALAKETEVAAAASAKDKATPEIIMAKTREAAALLEKDGDAAFDKFRGKDSPFVFCGTYVSVYDANAVVLFQPIKYKLVGKSLADLRDANGKQFMVDIMNVAKEKGEGWVDYVWPKPGEKTPSYKVGFIKKAVHGDKTYVINIGTNDLTPEQGAKLVAGK
ncbi:MAG: cache domain-containing protein [Planctomycetes bacterium]|nr:cache domain-containing protein [Planctomycetota bacterium]